MAVNGYRETRKVMKECLALCRRSSLQYLLYAARLLAIEAGASQRKVTE